MTDSISSHIAANEEFVRLFIRHQRQVHSYIATIVYDPADVEDVLQETAIVLWNKFDTFDTDRSFVKWACGIAHLQILSFCRKRKRGTLPLDPSTLELLLAERREMEEALDDRRQALASCMRQLRVEDRQLVERCYQPGARVKVIAEELQRSADSVSHSLTRIRRSLFDCVNRNLAVESH
ncbi:sigma-70 family RNA polymerase sigma factor [Calycomorphotria hydatis]|uniref:RNA polymerase sigma factor n=1 Tax=Calycomorphotria hydatis TaxID=2528027 RepID=A0A517T8H8_9PLAN|nr:sigma-70 family RNA polymerase sigma factor [Calycomorphotria hydatis]QDT64692.1 RNA polymerase sigma factor [Calycomorphotria hydatis]